MRIDGLHRAAHWNFARRQANGVVLKAAQGTPENPNGTTLPIPPVPWLYSYQVPVDSLAVRFIVPSLPSFAGSSPPPTTASVSAATQLPNGGMIPFQVALGTDSMGNAIEIILTNQSQAILVYTANNPIPTTWDSMFEAAFVSALAAFLAAPLSGNLQLAQGAVAKAEGIIAKARAADGNETSITQDHVPDWIVARAGAAGLGWNYGNNAFSPWMGGLYCDVAWPVLG